MPLLWCLIGAYQHYKRNSDSELIAIITCIGFMPVVNFVFGGYMFVTFLVDKLKERNFKNI